MRTKRERKGTREKPAKRTGRWVIAGLILLLLAGAFLFVYTARITEVTVTGSTRYTDEEIISMILDEEKDWNPFYALYQEQFGEHKDIPFVERYEVKLTGLRSARITIYEKSLAGCVEYMGSYLYFDRDGIVVESSGERDTAVPLITGLKFQNVVMYEPLTVEDDSVFQEIMNLSQLLSGYDMEVDRVNFAGSGQITLYMGSLKACLGDSRYLAEKVAELSDMLPQISGLAGTVYLDGYDPEAKNPSYPFVPDGS